MKWGNKADYFNEQLPPSRPSTNGQSPTFLIRPIRFELGKLDQQKVCVLFIYHLFIIFSNYSEQRELFNYSEQRELFNSKFASLRFCGWWLVLIHSNQKLLSFHYKFEYCFPEEIFSQIYLKLSQWLVTKFEKQVNFEPHLLPNQMMQQLNLISESWAVRALSTLFNHFNSQTSHFGVISV